MNNPGTPSMPLSSEQFQNWIMALNTNAHFPQPQNSSNAAIGNNSTPAPSNATADVAAATSQFQAALASNMGANGWNGLPQQSLGYNQPQLFPAVNSVNVPFASTWSDQQRLLAYMAPLVPQFPGAPPSSNIAASTGTSNASSSQSQPQVPSTSNSVGTDASLSTSIASKAPASTNPPAIFVTSIPKLPVASTSSTVANGRPQAQEQHATEQNNVQPALSVTNDNQPKDWLAIYMDNLLTPRPQKMDSAPPSSNIAASTGTSNASSSQSQPHVPSTLNSVGTDALLSTPRPQKSSTAKPSKPQNSTSKARKAPARRQGSNQRPQDSSVSSNVAVSTVPPALCPQVASPSSPVADEPEAQHGPIIRRPTTVAFSSIIQPVDTNWDMFAKHKLEVLALNEVRMFRPPITVKCAQLDPTAFYKIGIDFVRPNTKWYSYDAAEEVWLHKKNPPPSEIIDYDNFKWHELGIQTGKQLMNNVITFDKLFSSMKEIPDTHQRQHIRFQRYFEYIPTIKLFRVVDVESGKTSPDTELSLLPLSFIVTSKYHCEQMIALKTEAEGKKPRQKRKIDATNSPTSSADSNEASTIDTIAKEAPVEKEPSNQLPQNVPDLSNFAFPSTNQADPGNLQNLYNQLSQSCPVYSFFYGQAMAYIMSNFNHLF